MAVLKFNTPPQGREISKGKYGEARGLQAAHGDNIVLQHALSGEPLHHAQGANPNAGTAVLSTAPYIEPKAEKSPPPPDPRAGRCPGNDDTCMGWAHKESGYCLGHERSLGLR